VALKRLGAKTTKYFWLWPNLMFLNERAIESKIYSGLVAKIRRVSLGQRLRFLADNAGDLGQLNFLAASTGDEVAHSRMSAELKVCRSLLRLCVVEIEGQPQDAADIADWLIDSAPQDLCMEMIQLATDEFLLSGERAKK
jgi:hypothetical protein